MLHLVILATLGAATAMQPVPQGHAVFLAQGCVQCHAVSSAGIAKAGDDTVSAPDLAGIGQRHKPAWIKKWLQADKEQHDNTHLKTFKGTDEELQALVDWLMEQ